jgi:hypothetical protein
MIKGKELSEQEIVDTLRETKSLLTVLVEGKDDASVYRYLEDQINDLIDIDDVDVLICGGRPKLLNVFERRHEFKNTKTVFLADKDMWFFVGVPRDYEDIVFTDGYSIENDVYIESVFNGLLNRDERKLFEGLIRELSIWFAFEVNRYKETGDSKCDVSVDRVCPNNIFCPNFKKSINFVDPPQHLIDLICNEYTRSLRGKNLFQALLRFLNKNEFSHPTLLRLGAKLENPKIEELINKLSSKFQEYG